jgi:hypothetical protein
MPRRSRHLRRATCAPGQEREAVADAKLSRRPPPHPTNRRAHGDLGQPLVGPSPSIKSVGEWIVERRRTIAQ